MRLISQAGLSLLAAFPLAQAVPSITDVYPQQLVNLPRPPTKSLWQKFREGTVRTVFGLKEQQSHDAGKYDEQSRDAAGSRDTQDILVRFTFSTAAEVSKLSEISRNMYLDVWHHTNQSVDIRLSKATLAMVLRQLPKSMEHSHTAILQEKELKQAMSDTFPARRAAVKSGTSGAAPHRHFTPSVLSPSDPKSAEHNIFFNEYQPLSVIAPWMRLLASLFTTHVRLINIGFTHEGREILALRVGNHPTNDDDAAQPKRKTVLIMGGLHAREWISVSTVSYIAYSLITAYGKDAEVTHLLEDLDWVFIPTINPDGYVYSWDTDRLWRKNRQDTPLRFCHGIDLDRSFPFQWDGSTAGNPCSESYGGEAPLEGTEARALSDWMRNETLANNVDFVGLLDLHSYSQQILYPYSYSCDVEPPSLENLEELAAGLGKAIRINSGHSYLVRQACEGNVAFGSKQDGSKAVMFDSAGGSALDWIYHDVGVRFAYQVKLRDRGAYGFLLPREHIVPSGREMLEAALYFGRYIDGEFEMAAHRDSKQGRATKGQERKANNAHKSKLRSQAGW